ncbi:MAG: formylmethanofuran dehydrogenase subunit C [Planctomycetaceae bacterium]|nr:formylmethanofuran dehydrogenase subunit C [Planctomycetaceae bacterium]MCB9949859.1 formylmethanofuran dehydrogenase subunit C [Planctomycetaceae bacterium]
MALELELQTPSSIPLEVDTVRLENVVGQSAEEVAKTLIQRGNRQVELGEFFRVSGSAADDETIVWRGDCSKVKLIGSTWQRGSIRVEGNAGMHLGAEMSGGEILVEGNVSDWAGAEMKGGRIIIKGNAGHLVGAVYRGGRKGMTGGEILIEGNAGNEIGHTMRRGLIAIGGSIGDVAGVGMIAGTILSFGEVGIRHGAGMKRGTIGLFGTESPEMLPTFRFSCTYRPTFLPLYFTHLKRCGFPVPEDCFGAMYRRYCGDLLETGKGEILTRVASA